MRRHCLQRPDKGGPGNDRPSQGEGELRGCDLHVSFGIRSANPEGASDENLVGKTRGIDVILGGHSHTFMEKPAVYLNADGKSVPVLHTGKSGIYVGEMVLTLTEK